MSRRYDHGTIDARLIDMFEWLMRQSEGWQSENFTYRMWQSPGVTSGHRGHRILHETVPNRLRQVHEAYVLLMPFGQQALAYRFAWLRHEDGRVVTNRERAEKMGVSMRSWDRLLARAKGQLLETMKNPPGPLTAKAMAMSDKREVAQ